MKNFEIVFQTHVANMAMLQSSIVKLQNSRCLMEADMADLAEQFEHSFQHRRKLLAQLHGRRATEFGPTTFYRVYLLDGREGILASRDLLAPGDVRAIEAGGRLVDEHPGARSAEIWCGSRLVFSSRSATLAAA